METRANYVIVGIFTLVAILAAFGFVYWTAAFGDRGETATLRIRIPGSASGLGRGSAVLFNGVKVGDVQRVFIDVKNPTVAIADASVDRLTPLTPSTQADIGLAGLTGQANIELKGASLSEENLLDAAEREDRIAEITANPSAVTNLLQTAQDIFKRADNVLDQLEGFTNDVRGPLTETAQNVAKFSNALGENADDLDRFLANVSELSGELGSLSAKLDGTIQAAESIVRAVDPNKIKSVVDNAVEVSNNVKSSTEQLDGIVKGVETAVASINDFAQKADATLSKVDGVLSGVDAATVRSALQNIDQASASANRAAADIAKVTDTFGNRSADFDRLISQATRIGDQISSASARVNGVIQRVDDLLGSGQTEGVIADAGLALKSIRQVADNLNAQVGPIAAGINRFTSTGLSDVRSLVNESQRSIGRIEDAITDLSRNPQRIITGGDGTVRQYNGRARR